MIDNQTKTIMADKSKSNVKVEKWITQFQHVYGKGTWNVTLPAEDDTRRWVNRHMSQAIVDEWAADGYSTVHAFMDGLVSYIGSRVHEGSDFEVFAATDIANQISDGVWVQVTLVPSNTHVHRDALLTLYAWRQWIRNGEFLRGLAADSWDTPADIPVWACVPANHWSGDGVDCWGVDTQKFLQRFVRETLKEGWAA